MNFPKIYLETFCKKVLSKIQPENVLTSLARTGVFENFLISEQIY